METENAMPPRYDASATESKWYDAWEAAGCFRPQGDGEPWCVTIPPPNITGSLHMGHALCYPLQDAIGRYQRLRGRRVLVLPGQDHAGIATQSVVDKMLRKEGTSASALGREGFTERAWAWRRESGDTILRQLRALGCAFDWERTRFTLDERYAEAVLRVFVDWFDRGLIFRGPRVVNWDPKLKTSVSDIETLREVRQGALYHVRYPAEDGGEGVTVATTRPETIPADVAIAVHPSDPRYAGLVGKTVVAPLSGRRIPVIADAYVDPEFGTGALKITPAHDANDYAVGVRHALPMPRCLDDDARFVAPELPGDAPGRLDAFVGLDRNELRPRVVEALEAEGALLRTEPHEVALVISDRSGVPVEPLLSEQWFVDQPALAAPVIEATRAGEIRFVPERFERIFLDWMEGIRDWCISRQLWWGHRIPVWYTAEGEPFAGLTQEDAQAKAGPDKPLVRQDDDVLDTWFSSGLWPFATLGWPEATPDLEEFYPTAVLVTDRNIINLWVARMAMMSYDLLGKRPFADVRIYATVLNEKGQRMSKSLGTGVDPMQVIEKFGADALRWTLLSQTGDNQDLRYSEKKTEEGRNLANKIWNAVRFVRGGGSVPLPGPGTILVPGSADLERGAPSTSGGSTLLPGPGGILPPGSAGLDQDGPGTRERDAPTTAVDRWLLSRLHATEAAVRDAYDAYDLLNVCQLLYRFFWNDVCDRYIEVAKPRLQNPADAATPRAVLDEVVSAFLRMLHPVMPHLTEELWSHVRPGEGFVMLAAWPEGAGAPDPGAEAEIERVFDAVRALRALRAEAGLGAMAKAPVAYADGDLDADAREILRTQAWFERIETGRPEGAALAAHAGGLDLALPIEGLVDREKEIAKIEREEVKLRAELTKMRERLADPRFAERAPADKVEKARADESDLVARLDRLAERKGLFA